MRLDTKQIKEALKSVGHIGRAKVQHSEKKRIYFTNPETGRRHSCVEYRGDAFTVVHLSTEQADAINIQSGIKAIQLLNTDTYLVRS